MILGLHRTAHDPDLVVRAFDLSGPQSLLRLPEEIERDEAVQLEALLYTDPLAAFELEEGALERAEEGQRQRSLPAPDELYRVTLPEKSPEWTPVDEASTALAAYQILDPGPRGCVDFTSEPFSLGDPTNTELALAVSSTVVLIGMRSGLLLRWTPFDLETVEMTPSTTLSHGAWDEVEGVWWLMNRYGQLFKGTFESPAALSLQYVTQSQPPFDQRYRIVLRREQGEPRIYSIRSDGLFQRFEPGGVTDLYAFEDADFGNNTILTPELDVLAAASGSTDVVRVSLDGELRVEGIPASAGFTAARYVEGLGVVLGSSDGQFFVHQDREWREIRGSPLEVFPFVIAPYRGGFLYGAAFGTAGQYSPEGYCDLEEQLAAYSIQHMVEVRDGFLVLGQNPNVPETPGQLVRLLERN